VLTWLAAAPLAASPPLATPPVAEPQPLGGPSKPEQKKASNGFAVATLRKPKSAVDNQPLQVLSNRKRKKVSRRFAVAILREPKLLLARNHRKCHVKESGKKSQRKLH
jgi:hypothetical protein